jgi:putative ABC transport system permease protein
MNFVARSLNSLRSRKSSTITTMIIFAVIFTFIFSSMIVYSSTSKTLGFLKRSITSAVTIDSVNITRNDHGAMVGGSSNLLADTVSKLISSDYVDKYNISDFCKVTFNGKYNKISKNYSSESNVQASDASLYSTINTEYDCAFTVNGYRLLEGSHISDTDGGKNVCLISKEFADLNSLKLADKIICANEIKPSDTYELEIAGIFEVPDGEYLEGCGTSPKEIIFVPYSTLQQHLNRKKISGSVTVFLKNNNDIDSYISELKSKGNLVKVYEDPFDVSEPELTTETKDLSLDELLEYYDENNCFVVKIDRGWYDLVAKPIEKVKELSFYIIASFVLSALIIIVLICILSVKKRKKEYGVLLSMGESKSRITIQMLIENLVPLIVAVALGIVMGNYIGLPVIEHFTDAAYETQMAESKSEIATQSAEYNAVDTSDHGYNHSGLTDLLDKTSSRISAASNTAPELKASDVITVVILVLALTVISTLIQMVYILRLNPKDIMTGKG